MEHEIGYQEGVIQQCMKWHKALSIKILKKDSEYWTERNEQWYCDLKIHNINLTDLENKLICMRCYLCLFELAYGAKFKYFNIFDRNKMNNNELVDIHDHDENAIYEYNDETGFFTKKGMFKYDKNNKKFIRLNK